MLKSLDQYTLVVIDGRPWNKGGNIIWLLSSKEETDLLINCLKIVFGPCEKTIYRYIQPCRAGFSDSDGTYKGIILCGYHFDRLKDYLKVEYQSSS